MSISPDNHLRTIVVGGGDEVGGIHTGGNAILQHPQDGLVVEVRELHIHEGVDH